MAATSARNLVAGSGTVSVTQGSRVLTFSQNQSFKEGTVIAGVGTNPPLTIDSGSGTVWVALQAATASASGVAFSTSDTSSSRARGSGPIAPRAMHYLYRAPIDSSGNLDPYLYFDPLFPENGHHPYTRDPWTGLSWFSGADTSTPAFVPDIATRVRVLEGIARGPNGRTWDPDTRLDSITSRLVALEQWANSAGHFGTPPPVGDGSTYTLDQLTGYGDPAPLGGSTAS